MKITVKNEKDNTIEFDVNQFGPLWKLCTDLASDIIPPEKRLFNPLKGTRLTKIETVNFGFRLLRLYQEGIFLKLDKALTLKSAEVLTGNLKPSYKEKWVYDTQNFSTTIAKQFIDFILESHTISVKGLEEEK